MQKVKVGYVNGSMRSLRYDSEGRAYVQMGDKIFVRYIQKRGCYEPCMPYQADVKK